MLQFLFLLLPVAAYSGWHFGQNKKQQDLHHDQLPNKLRRDYFQGLNYLINEQPDKAVDVFIKLVEVDSDTVETHLALGALFRRRGEVDRAIRVHQNLIARPQLAKEYRMAALSELGQDYLSAGVLDRAERLFLELVELGEQSQASLNYLLHIYQQEKDWQQAITTAHKLALITKQSMNHVIAQYYCELAETQEEAMTAIKYLKKAQAVDTHSVRANMLRGKLAAYTGNHREAIHYYQQAIRVDPDFISEVIAPLCRSYRQLNDEDAMVTYLHQALLKHPRTAIAIELSDYLQYKHNVSDAIEFIAEYIQKNPSMRGLDYLVELYLLNAYGDTEKKLTMLHDFMTQLQHNKPVYQCQQCGFSGKSLYWLCPSCHHWNTTKPIQGLEGN